MSAHATTRRRAFAAMALIARRAWEVRIGVSGWTYPPWRGRFYPKGLPHNQVWRTPVRCSPASRSTAPSISMQRPDTFARWVEATPDGFVFAVKGRAF